MKNVVKIITIIIATAAVAQTFSAYASRTEASGVPLTAEQCEDLRVRLDAYMASEQFENSLTEVTGNGSSRKSADRLVNELKAVIRNQRSGDIGP